MKNQQLLLAGLGTAHAVPAKLSCLLHSPELQPCNDLQLQFRVAHQLPAARGGRLAAGVPAWALARAAARLPQAAGICGGYAL